MIFRNMEGTRTKEVEAKEEETIVREVEVVAKGRKVTINIDIVHK